MTPDFMVTSTIEIQLILAGKRLPKRHKRHLNENNKNHYNNCLFENI